MNKSIAVALSCLLAVATVRAQDMDKKEPMPMEPKMEQKMEQKHAMKTKPMRHDAKKPKAMMKDDAAMKTMPHDDMGKAMPMQPAVTNR